MVYLRFIVLLTVATAWSWNPMDNIRNWLSTSYTPFKSTCPQNANFLRSSSGLCNSEKIWLEGRDGVTKPALVEWLSNSGLQDFDATKFLSNSTIRLGISFSGGGYRALLNGAGQFAAFDSRTPGTLSPGHMGGLVQASTYLTGLSGGGWLVSSLVVNNWTTVDALVKSTNIWNFTRYMFQSSGDSQSYTTTFLTKVAGQVASKAYIGWFNCSATDVYGRFLSYQLFDATEGGLGLDYHTVRNYDAFKTYQMPFPIHVMDGRAPGTKIINMNSTNFEFNPFELGSWDPNVHAFTDIEYLGTEVSDGKPKSNVCYKNFDNVGFLTGTSASLFNNAINFIDTNSLGWLKALVARLFLKFLDYQNYDIASYTPNPFFGMKAVDNSITRSQELALVDGGEDGQNIPLQPLLQLERKVDIVFAMDNSADTLATGPHGANWANGTSLVATYQRQFGSQANGTHFPNVPDTDTFVYAGLNQQPTFFGCSIENLTAVYQKDQPPYYPPVVVYMANTQHSFASNASTDTIRFTDDEFHGIMGNGYNLVTQNNGTLDSEWRTCVACAIVLREQQRRGQSPTSQCQKCFEKYCWDGSFKTAANGKAGRRDGKSNIVGGSRKAVSEKLVEFEARAVSESSTTTVDNVQSINGAPAIGVNALVPLLGLLA